MLSAVDWSGVATKRGHSLWSARGLPAVAIVLV